MAPSNIYLVSRSALSGVVGAYEDVEDARAALQPGEGIQVVELKPRAPRLVGDALQTVLIAEGVVLCRSCKGKAQVYDCEDEEMMGCPRCSGTGRAA